MKAACSTQGFRRTGLGLPERNGCASLSIGSVVGAVPGGLEGRSYDDITTGSIRTVRGHDSAQEGNANQPSFLVQQYGQTSGGTAR